MVQRLTCNELEMKSMSIKDVDPGTLAGGIMAWVNAGHRAEVA